MVTLAIVFLVSQDALLAFLDLELILAVIDLLLLMVGVEELVGMLRVNRSQELLLLFWRKLGEVSTHDSAVHTLK